MVRKSPVSLYKRVGLEMYEAGRTPQEVKYALKVLDRYFQEWKTNTRSRDAERLAVRIWDEYGEQEARKIVEKASKRERIKSRQIPGMTRHEQAKKWLEEFLNRPEEKPGRQVNQLCLFGRAERGFARQQVYDALDELEAEGRLTRTPIATTGRRGGRAKLVQWLDAQEQTKK